MRASVDLFRPPDEGLDESIGNVIENRADHFFKNLAGKIVLQPEFHLARRVGKAAKMPGAVQAPERAVDEADGQAMRRFLAIFRGEMRFDAVIIDMQRRHGLALVAELNRQGKLVAMICHGGWVGVSAGIVKGTTLTSMAAIKDDMINAGATWVDQSVVVHGNLVTSRSPADLPDFMREALRVLGQQK